MSELSLTLKIRIYWRSSKSERYNSGDRCAHDWVTEMLLIKRASAPCQAGPAARNAELRPHSTRHRAPLRRTSRAKLRRGTLSSRSSKTRLTSWRMNQRQRPGEPARIDRWFASWLHALSFCSNCVPQLRHTRRLQQRASKPGWNLKMNRDDRQERPRPSLRSLINNRRPPTRKRE